VQPVGDVDDVGQLDRNHDGREVLAEAGCSLDHQLLPEHALLEPPHRLDPRVGLVELLHVQPGVLQEVAHLLHVERLIHLRLLVLLLLRGFETGGLLIIIIFSVRVASACLLQKCMVILVVE